MGIVGLLLVGRRVVAPQLGRRGQPVEPHNFGPGEVSGEAAAHGGDLCTRVASVQSVAGVALTYCGGAWERASATTLRLAKPFNQSTHLNQSYDMAGLAEFVIPRFGLAAIVSWQFSSRRTLGQICARSVRWPYRVVSAILALWSRCRRGREQRLALASPFAAEDIRPV
jgi:hypothetical protein